MDSMLTILWFNC